MTPQPSPETLAARERRCPTCDSIIPDTDVECPRCNDELAALRARVLELEEALKGEILGIPCDVNTVRWAERCDKLEAKAEALATALEECFWHLGEEIKRKTLNESAGDGTQALSLKVGKALDAWRGRN